MQTDGLTSLLQELHTSSTDIEASVIISTDGQLLAAMLPVGLDENRLAAMSAALFALASRTSQELSCGSVDHLWIKGRQGLVLLVGAGQRAVVAVLVKSSDGLGRVLSEVKRVVEKIAPLI